MNAGLFVPRYHPNSQRCLCVFLHCCINLPTTKGLLVLQQCWVGDGYQHHLESNHSPLSLCWVCCVLCLCGIMVKKTPFFYHAKGADKWFVRQGLRADSGDCGPPENL